MKKLLVTGARGFIGRHILAPAIERGYEVHATASDSELPSDLSALPVTWHSGDLLRPGAAEELIGHVRPTHLLNAAWETGHGDYWTSASNLSWLGVTMNMLHAFAAAGGRRYIGVGTCAEYEWTADRYHETGTPLIPATLYGQAKLCAHRMAAAAGAQLGFGAATGRIFFAYGPYENENRLIPYACRKLARGEEAQFASGTLIRDFLHVRDAGQAFVTLMDSDLDGAVNIASGTGVRLGALVEAIGQAAGRPDLVKLGALPDRPGDPPVMVADTGRIAGLGWHPSIDLEQGLQDVYDWWRDR